MQVNGTIPPMVTPVNESGEIDVNTLRTFTDTLIQGGVHGLFPVGSIGEFSSLTRDQRTTVIESVVEVSDDCPVLAGCGGTSFRDVQKHLSDAAAVGADVGVVVTPFYLKTSQEGLCRFFEQLADESPLPFYLYNIPQLTGVDLSIDSVVRLANHKNIVGIKDSAGDFTYIIDLLDSVPDSFSVLQGIPTLGIPSLDYGADGIVAGPANVFPGPVAEFYNSYQEEDRKRTQHLLQTVIAPVITAIQTIPSASAFKYLLSNRGLDVGDPLLPLPPLTENQRSRLDECYNQVSEFNQTPTIN